MNRGTGSRRRGTVGTIARMQEGLKQVATLFEALELVLARLQPDRDPLAEYLDETKAYGPGRRLQPLPPAIAPARERGRLPGMAARVARRNMARARRLAMPGALGAALLILALVRLPSANTAWTEQLTVNSNVGTGDFKCDPVKLEFVETVKVGSDTKFVYALSGGGGTGPKCQSEALAAISIPVCFNPATKPGGDVVAESHPGNVAASWKAGKTPKAVTWDAVTSEAPLGGKGPFDPKQMRFSFTLAGAVSLSPIAVHATLKAGAEETDGGAVKVPACPLPSTAAQKAEVPSAAVAPDAPAAPAPPTSTPTPTPKPATAPVGPAVGGRGSGAGGAVGTVKPTATPTPLGVMIWD